MSPREAAPASFPTGNAFDKYGSGHPVVRRLVRSFTTALDELIDCSAPGSILDVGCGEGILTHRWAVRNPTAQVVGVDLAAPGLQAQWRSRRAENLQFHTACAEELPFADDAFDLVAAIEALEHVADPLPALAEMARTARRHVLVSVPREPLWRLLNVLRGSYLDQLGNTPGHVHHFSRHGVLRLLEGYGEVIAVRSPFPWTVALLQVG